MNYLIANLFSVIFIIFLISYIVRAIFIVYHLLRFGLDYKTKLLALIFSAGSALLISSSYYLFSRVQWTEFVNEYFSLPKII